MKILVVEDNYNKVQVVHDVFKGIGRPEIKTVRSSQEAKSLLSVQKYDFLILDVQIPDIEGGDVSSSGGIDLLAFIETSNDIHIPNFIMGLTSHNENFESVKFEFAEFGWPLFNTKSEHKIWSKLLLRKFAGRNNNIHNLKADVAILTALEHTELESVLALECNWDNVIIDGFHYHLGEIRLGSGEQLTIVAAASDRMGVSAASALTTRVGLIFEPKFMIMTGICAGVRSKVELGDVVIADHTWDWGSGKISELDGELKFFPDPHQIPLHRTHRNIVKTYSVKCPFMEEIYMKWRGNRGEHKPVIHLAPMACGSQVVANSSIIDQILEGNRKMLALEMESYGFLNGCEELGISAMVAKSICDFADSEKSDDAHKYASYTSASFALKYIQENYLTIF